MNLGNIQKLTKNTFVFGRIKRIKVGTLFPVGRDGEYKQ